MVKIKNCVYVYPPYLFCKNKKNLIKRFATIFWTLPRLFEELLVTLNLNNDESGFV